jgi:hypothetical protein
MLDKRRGRGFLHLFQHPAALAADPPAAHVEDLHRGFELVFRERDDIAVGAVAEHYRLLFQRPFQRLDIVAQPRRLFVFLIVGGGFHFRGQLLDEPLRVARHEIAEILGERPVLLGRDALHARRAALSDISQQARPADLPGALEDALGARADREDAQEGVHRVADRPGVTIWPEVFHALAFRAAHHHHAGEFLVHRDGEIGV